jgi:hypothetical protein
MKNARRQGLTEPGSICLAPAIGATPPEEQTGRMAGSRGDGPGASGPGGFGSNGPAPDGRHDDLAPDELQRLDITIPDDASDLDIDRERWLAEEAFDASDAVDASAPEPSTPSTPIRPSSANPPTDTTDTGAWREQRDARRRRLAITAAVVAVSMLTVAISGAVGAWIVGPQASPGPQPLASTDAQPGEVGGLLPADAMLQNGESGISAQSLRPAVIAIIPASCFDCDQLLTTLAPQVGSFGVPLMAVGGPEQAAQLDALSDAVGSSRLITLIDNEQTLRTVYSATGTTLLLVRADGALVDVIRDPAPGVPLDSRLVELVPGVGHQT